MILGKRYGGIEAERAGIVDEVAPPDQLREAAIAAANRLAGPGLDTRTVSTLKRDLYSVRATQVLLPALAQR